jgi:hypothetical protein
MYGVPITDIDEIQQKHGINSFAAGKHLPADKQTVPERAAQTTARQHMRLYTPYIPFCMACNAEMAIAAWSSPTGPTLL